jgi:hypothetical protein
MSADRKYTDRDVRENPEMYRTVVDYLDAYEGEFDFLVDCKMRVAMDRDLTVGMVRGVLNCMRHDPRVTNLPEPLPPYEGKVLHMPRKKKKVQRRDCDIEEFHGRHGFRFEDHPEFDGYYPCEGKYPINRRDFMVPASVKVPFMMSKSGKMIHQISSGPEAAWYMWRPNAHAWDFWREPDLYVRTACQYPRHIINPTLLNTEQLSIAKREPVGASAHPHEYCKRCFSVGLNCTEEV